NSGQARVGKIISLTRKNRLQKSPRIYLILIFKMCLFKRRCFRFFVTFEQIYKRVVGCLNITVYYKKRQLTDFLLSLMVHMLVVRLVGEGMRNNLPPDEMKMGSY